MGTTLGARRRLSATFALLRLHRSADERAKDREQRLPCCPRTSHREGGVVLPRSPALHARAHAHGLAPALIDIHI